MNLQKLVEQILGKNLHNLASQSCEHTTPMKEELDDALVCWKQLEPSFADKTSVHLVHECNKAYTKLRNFACACEAIDLIQNILPTKQSKAERAATVRDYSKGWGGV